MPRINFIALWMLLVPAAVAHGGACCLDDGTYVDLPEADFCDLIYAGIWQGELSSCETVECTNGACCVEDFESIC